MHRLFLSLVSLLVAMPLAARQAPEGKLPPVEETPPITSPEPPPAGFSSLPDGAPWRTMPSRPRA